jgi:hypothetical protein
MCEPDATMMATDRARNRSSNRILPLFSLAINRLDSLDLDHRLSSRRMYLLIPRILGATHLCIPADRLAS